MTNSNTFNETNACLNCGDDFRFGEDFCEKCGQKSSTGRIDTHFLTHNIIHTLTHGDKGIFHLVKELTKNPGQVVKEYVGGKRANISIRLTLYLSPLL